MKHLLVTLLVAFICTPTFSINKIVNPFGGFSHDHPEAYWHDYPTNPETGKDLYRFYSHCCDYGYKQNVVNKLLDEYGKLIQNHPEDEDAAQCYLAYYYLRSDGIMTSFQDGFQLLDEALARLESQDDGLTPEKQSFLANFYDLKAWAYLTGRGVGQDYYSAYVYYMLAAEKNRYSQEALVRLFYCSILGIGAPVDDDRALDLCSEIIDFSLQERYAHYYVLYPDGRSLFYILEYQFKQFIPVDIENHFWSNHWCSQNDISEVAVNACRQGMIDWLVNRDFERAKTSFEKAIELGYIPAMTELGMMYLDDAWGLKNGDELFMKILSEAAEAGYLPSKYIIGQRILNHWGKKNPFSSSVEGEAYPYFLAVAEEGFQPAKELLVKYSDGTLSTKTGFAAAISDLNEGFNDGQTEKKSLLENLLEVGSGYASLGYAIAARNSSGSNNVVSSSSPSASSGRSTGSSYSSESTQSLSDFQIHQNNEAAECYEKWEKHAEHWIDRFMEEYAWLELSDPKSDSNLELSHHHRAYSDAIFGLKNALKSLQQQRQKSNNWIPKGEIEEKVEWCLAQKYPE